MCSNKLFNCLLPVLTMPHKPLLALRPLGVLTFVLPTLPHKHFDDANLQYLAGRALHELFHIVLQIDAVPLGHMFVQQFWELYQIVAALPTPWMRRLTEDARAQLSREVSPSPRASKLSHRSISPSPCPPPPLIIPTPC